MAADFNYSETLHGKFKLSPELPVTLIMSAAEQTILAPRTQCCFPPIGQSAVQKEASSVVALVR